MLILISRRWEIIGDRVAIANSRHSPIYLVGDHISIAYLGCVVIEVSGLDVNGGSSDNDWRWDVCANSLVALDRSSEWSRISVEIVSTLPIDRGQSISVKPVDDRIVRLDDELYDVRNDVTQRIGVEDGTFDNIGLSISV